jgi:hypothetical protein
MKQDPNVGDYNPVLSVRVVWSASVTQFLHGKLEEVVM